VGAILKVGTEITRPAAHGSAGVRTAQERIDEIRSLAVQLGLDPHDVCGRFSYEKVVREAGEATRLSADMTAFLWRLTSGFAHGRYWATLSTLQRQALPATGNVLNVQLTQRPRPGPARSPGPRGAHRPSPRTIRAAPANPYSVQQA
jgi:hypothetical protein